MLGATGRQVVEVSTSCGLDWVDKQGENVYGLRVS